MKSKILFLLSLLILLVYSLEQNKKPQNVSNQNKTPQNKNNQNQKEQKSTVLTLTDNTFEKHLNREQTLITLFYSPDCPHSAKLMPEFTRASDLISLKKDIYKIKFAKVDAESQRKLAELYQIQVFPTIIGFSKNEQITYVGKRKANSIVNWALKKFYSPLRNIATENALRQLITGNDVFAVLFTEEKDDSKLMKTYSQASVITEEFPFGVFRETKLFEKLQVKEKNTLVLYKKTDEKRREMKLTPQTTPKEIQSFLYRYSFKSIDRYTDESSSVIFEKNQAALVVFPSPTNDQNNLITMLAKLSKEKIQYKLHVYHADPGYVYTDKLLEYLGLKKKILPTFRILDHRNGQRLKVYAPKDGAEVNEKNIMELINSWEKGAIKETFKSQDEIRNLPKQAIKNLVSKNYHKYVIDNNLDVFVVFYAPWCGHCKLLLHDFDLLGEKLKGNKGLLLAKIDATENDVENIELDGFPTALFYAGNKKNEKPIEYEGDRSVDDMIKFIKEHASNPIEVGEKKKPKDKPKEKKDEKKQEKKQDEGKDKKDEPTSDL